MNAITIPTLPSPLPAPVVVQEFVQRKDALLAKARKGKCITSPDSCTRAVALVRELKEFTSGIEDARTQAKKPILEMGRAIDEIARTLTDEVLGEQSRIQRLIGEFEAEQRRIEAEARAKAAAESRRLYMEAQERERKLMEEASAKAAQATSEEERKAIQSQAMKQAEELDRTTMVQTAKAIELAGANVPAKTAGTVVRKNLVIEVVDPHALYQHSPAMVVLKPNTAALKAYLKTLPEGAEVPGVKWYVETTASIRG